MTDLGLPSDATPHSFQRKFRHWGSLRISSASSVIASLFPFVALILYFIHLLIQTSYEILTEKESSA